MKRYAIAGFGGAGYNAAKAIRALDREAVIDVYSDTGLGAYNPMLTTYYVKGAIPYGALFPFGSLEETVRELGLNYHPNCPVTGLDPQSRTLRTAEGEARYDAILISTGASAIMPPIPGLDLPGVFKMRTAQDAEDLRTLLSSGKVKSCLVIGASWVGIKVIEDLRERPDPIPCTLVDGADWMFYAAAFQETALRAQRDLEARGVEVACGQMLDHIEQEGSQLTAVMKSGRRFTADAVAVCIGVRMNVGFLRDSGVAMDRGVLVDSRMQTSCPGIYAAGDCCEATDIQSGKKRNIGVWANAGRQGMVAGTNMAGGSAEFDANVLVNLAHYMDYDFLSIGDVSACKPEDTVYEYEDERYYIRAVRDGRAIKCINMIGAAESSGIIKNAFIKSIENPGAALDIRSVCHLRKNGFPDDFINFLGGTSRD